MKRLISAAAIGLMTLGFASSASAGNYHFTPLDTAFTANGSVTITAAGVNYVCTTALNGTTVGGGSITSATFSGVSCNGLQASGLPWKMTTHSATGATFHGVTISSEGLGTCGPSRVQATLPGGNKITITGSGLSGVVPCSLSGTLVTTPALKIVHN